MLQTPTSISAARRRQKSHFKLVASCRFTMQHGISHNCVSVGSPSSAPEYRDFLFLGYTKHSGKHIASNVFFFKNVFILLCIYIYQGMEEIATYKQHESVLTCIWGKKKERKENVGLLISLENFPSNSLFVFQDFWRMVQYVHRTIRLSPGIGRLRSINTPLLCMQQ